MFAIGLWDREQKKLSLIWDRMGEKPLYYGQVDGDFAFASELKGFRAAFGTSLRINDAVLCAYLRAGYIPAPVTVYRDVQKLPAGHLLCIDISSRALRLADPRPYWSIEDVMPPVGHSVDKSSTGILEEQMAAIIDKAVAERTVSDVSVGVFLSGGIDSSLVTAVMARQSNTPVRAFTIRFEDPRYDESPYARAANLRRRAYKASP